MTPALAHGSVLISDTMWALIEPSPGKDCQSKWKRSYRLQISLPPALIVQVPLLSDSAPEGKELAMSAQLHPVGQSTGGTGAFGVTETVSIVTLPSVAPFCAVVAKPACNVDGNVKTWVESWMGVQLTPSFEV